MEVSKNNKEMIEQESKTFDEWSNEHALEHNPAIRTKKCFFNKAARKGLMENDEKW